jgi:hypothetical protein
MARRFHGGSPVAGGYYLNASRWAVQPVERDGDRLPPGPGEWRPIPLPLALLLVPLLGVTFLMFMPAAGFLVLGKFLWERLRGLFVRPPAQPEPVEGRAGKGPARAAPEAPRPAGPDRPAAQG